MLVVVFLLFLVNSEYLTHRCHAACPFAKRNDVDDTYGQKRTSTCPYTQVTCDRNAAYRTMDGSCNNLDHNTIWGKAGTPQKRLMRNRYQDGKSSARTLDSSGQGLPSARVTSTKINQDDQFTDFQDYRYTHLLMQWGQFTDHDITYTPQIKEADNSEPICCAEDLPSGSTLTQTRLDQRPDCLPMMLTGHDRHFKTRRCMNFVRSVQTTPLDCSDGPKEQLNSITSFIDGSQIYGSSKARLARVRNGSTPFLKTSANNLLPHESTGEHCIKDNVSDYCYLAGDVRVNVQPALMSLQTIFMREHNRIATELVRITSWDNDKVFFETRKIIGGLLQHITYNEWLPIILGNHYGEYDLNPTSYGFKANVYNSSVDPRISVEFATAAFRFGHSMIQTNFSRKFGSFDEKTRLRHLYGRPKYIAEDNGAGLNRIINGLITDVPEKSDRWYTLEITDHLFEMNNNNALDLAALNAQRGRDHGLATYNDARRFFNLSPATSFTPGTTTGLQDVRQIPAQRLQHTYSHPDDIDLYQGGISENNGRGELGPIFTHIVSEQFERLRHGDRFFYEREDPLTGFSRAQIDSIKKIQLGRIICDNTDLTSLPKNVFLQPSTAHPHRSNPVVDCSNSYNLPPLNLRLWSDATSQLVG